MASMSVDGQDVEAVYRATPRVTKQAREGKGPTLMVCKTFRLTGHYIGDPQVYRPKEEVREVRRTPDPITTYCRLSMP